MVWQMYLCRPLSKVALNERSAITTMTITKYVEYTFKILASILTYCVGRKLELDAMIGTYIAIVFELRSLILLIYV